MDSRRSLSDTRHMTTATLTKIAPAASSRLLADVNALARSEHGQRASALVRLEAALGRDFADRLVAALSTERERRAVN